MQNNGDGKDFGHHLEMAHLHSKSMTHHLQQMTAMHGKTDVGDADEGEAGPGADAVGHSSPYEGKETAVEEAGESKQELAQRKRRR